jgi:protein-S-isoprenylcysteine O-methyltransferase Ste14
MIVGPSGPPGPGVSVPPPLIFVGGWLVAWLPHRSLPFAIDGGGVSSGQTFVGGLALLAGLTLMAWGIATFISSRTPIVPTRPARVLVEQGPYRFTRNPIYLGMTVAYCGLAALFNLVWPLLVLPGVVVLVLVMVIRREERHLLATFGDDYRQYRRRVRRWV